MTNLILGHTHIRGDVVLVEVLLNVLERTEHTDALHTPGSDICTSTVYDLTIDIVILEVHNQYLVVVETSVQSNLVLEVLTNLVTPVDAEFPTPAVHLTKVGGSRLCTNGGRYVLSEVQQHLTVALLIVVNVDGKTTVQQLEVKTDIGLIRLIPVYVTVDGRGVLVDRATSVLTWVLVGRLTEYDTLVLIKCVDLQPLPWCQVITTSDIPAGTDLQEVNPLQPFYILEPRLLADNPTCGDSREGSQ